MDQFLVHPDYIDKIECDLIEPLSNTCAVPTSPPSVQWQNLNTIENY